jgi:hypothetical protein
MLQRFQSSIPLFLIAGSTQAVQLQLPCQPTGTNCCEPGCDTQKNDVGVDIDFNVHAKQSDHGYHDLAPLPTEIDIEVANIIAQLEAKQK